MTMKVYHLVLVVKKMDDVFIDVLMYHIYFD